LVFSSITSSGDSGQLSFQQTIRSHPSGVQRGGDLRFFHAEDVKSGTLAQYIKENVSQDVDILVTDDFRIYPKAMIEAGIHGRKHKTINSLKKSM
jgi:hypothetical protein